MTTQQLEIWRKITAESESNLEARIKFDKYMEEQQEGMVGIREVRIPSFGEQLVGLDFNPSGDADVHRVKELAAEMAEILKRRYTEDKRTPVKSLLFDHAVGEILNAQMNVVKVITMNPKENETI
jgi:hypothetical protein